MVRQASILLVDNAIIPADVFLLRGFNGRSSFNGNEGSDNNGAATSRESQNRAPSRSNVRTTNGSQQDGKPFEDAARSITGQPYSDLVIENEVGQQSSALTSELPSNEFDARAPSVTSTTLDGADYELDDFSVELTNEGI